jgi:hypothetical protein
LFVLGDNAAKSSTAGNARIGLIPREAIAEWWCGVFREAASKYTKRT